MPFNYAHLVRDMHGPMFQFLERALAVHEESRLWTAQRVWLAWIRPWRYRAKYYDQVLARSQSNPSPADTDILRRLTAATGGNPPEDAYSPEYQSFVRENIDCYCTLLHVWTERVAQVQYPVHLDLGSGAKAQVSQTLFSHHVSSLNICPVSVRLICILLSNGCIFFSACENTFTDLLFVCVFRIHFKNNRACVSPSLPHLHVEGTFE